MDELEKLRKHWQDDDFQRKHALAREIVVNRLRELNREYEEKTGQGFVRFIETRMKTPESIAEKLQRKDYDVDFDTAVTSLNDISGVRCICYKNYIRKPKKKGYERGHIVLDIPMSYKGKTTVVRVELQLRTMIMDAWAGMDNRVSYKKGVPPEMERRIEKYARIGRRLDKLIQKTLDDSKTV